MEVITWTDTDQVDVVEDVEVLLNNFMGYVDQVSIKYDAMLLFTYVTQHRAVMCNTCNRYTMHYVMILLLGECVYMYLTHELIFI